MRGGAPQGATAVHGSAPAAASAAAARGGGCDGGDPVVAPEAGAGERCTCPRGHRDACRRGLQLLTWYTQVPGNRLSMWMQPHRSTHFHAGRQVPSGARFDLAAVLNSRSFFTTLLTMRSAQLVVFALGLWWTAFGMHAIAASVFAGRPLAQCAKVGITLRHGDVVHGAAPRERLELGLLAAGCRVEGGEQSYAADAQMHMVTFPGPVEFNGLEVNAPAFSLDGDGQAADVAFVVECLDELPARRRVLAASGKCGWFAGVEEADRITIAHALPLTRMRETLDTADGRSSRAGFRSNYALFRCTIPPILSACGVLLTGVTLILTAAHARYFTRAGAFGIDLPITILSLGCCGARLCCMVGELLAWKPSVPFALYYASKVARLARCSTRARVPRP